MPKRVSDENRYVVDSKTGCWNYTMSIAPTTGYGQYVIGYKILPAHRYFYEKYRGKVKSGLELDHLCRNRKCCNPSHLEEVSRAENVRRGLLAKLNYEKVKEIRSLYDHGVGQSKLADIFGVNQSQISRVVNNLRWNCA